MNIKNQYIKKTHLYDFNVPNPILWLYNSLLIFELMWWVKTESQNMLLSAYRYAWNRNGLAFWAEERTKCFAFVCKTSTIRKVSHIGSNSMWTNLTSLGGGCPGTKTKQTIPLRLKSEWSCLLGGGTHQMLCICV